MSVSNSILRIVAYWKRHGVRTTVSRAVQAVNRMLFSRRMVLFYFDLGKESHGSSDIPLFLCVERKRSEGEIGQSDLQEFLSFWNPKIASQEMRERFEQGASLWMIKMDGKLAGYGWTLRGHTIEPHFFVLGKDDVHLFDYYVAPSYRGRGLNPLLVNHILASLAAECGGRAFIEAAEWNHAQLASLRKTPFIRMGCAWKMTIGNRTIVGWASDRVAEFKAQGTINDHAVANTAEPHRPN